MDLETVIQSEVSQKEKNKYPIDFRLCFPGSSHLSCVCVCVGWTLFGVSLFISCKNKTQCVCVCEKKKKTTGCETSGNDLNF